MVIECHSLLLGQALGIYLNGFLLDVSSELIKLIRPVGRIHSTCKVIVSNILDRLAESSFGGLAYLQLFAACSETQHSRWTQVIGDARSYPFASHLSASGWPSWPASALGSCSPWQQLEHYYAREWSVAAKDRGED